MKEVTIKIPTLPKFKKPSLRGFKNAGLKGAGMGLEVLGGAIQLIGSIPAVLGGAVIAGGSITKGLGTSLTEAVAEAQKESEPATVYPVEGIATS